jgi:hypothetical protein
MAYNSTSVYPDSRSTDIQVTNGSIDRAYLSDSVLENVKQRILTVYQEWFLNLNEGLPWFTELTGKNVNIETVKAHIARAVNSTVGVLELMEITLIPNPSNRKLNVSFKYKDIYGETRIGDL